MWPPPNCALWRRAQPPTQAVSLRPVHLYTLLQLHLSPRDQSELQLFDYLVQQSDRQPGRNMHNKMVLEVRTDGCSTLCLAAPHTYNM